MHSSNESGHMRRESTGLKGTMRDELRESAGRPRVDGQQREGWTDPAVSAAHAPPAKEDGHGAVDHRCGSSASLQSVES